MKLLLTLAFMLPLLSCSPLWNKSSGSNPRPDGPATSYEYSYNGTMMYPIKKISGGSQPCQTVKRGADGAVRIAFLRNNEPEVRVIAGPEDFFARVYVLVAEYGLHRLKESYRPRMEVLDGYDWHVRIRFRENAIYSGGFNAGPSGKLASGIAALNQYVESLIDASSEEEVIFRQDYQEYLEQE